MPLSPQCLLALFPVAYRACIVLLRSLLSTSSATSRDAYRCWALSDVIPRFLRVLSAVKRVSLCSAVSDAIRAIRSLLQALCLSLFRCLGLKMLLLTGSISFLGR